MGERLGGDELRASGGSMRRSEGRAIACWVVVGDSSSSQWQFRSRVSSWSLIAFPRVTNGHGDASVEPTAATKRAESCRTSSSATGPRCRLETVRCFSRSNDKTL